MLKTSALETPYGGQITLSPQLITKFSCNAPGHWCSTTVRLETYPLFQLRKTLLSLLSISKNNFGRLVFHVFSSSMKSVFRTWQSSSTFNILFPIYWLTQRFQHRRSGQVSCLMSLVYTLRCHAIFYSSVVCCCCVNVPRIFYTLTYENVMVMNK